VIFPAALSKFGERPLDFGAVIALGLISADRDGEAAYDNGIPHRAQIGFDTLGVDGESQWVRGDIGRQVFAKFPKAERSQLRFGQVRGQLP
jgi:hypothetical protein